MLGRVASALVMLGVGWAAAAGPLIQDRPIPFDAERLRLTEDYWRQHYGEPASHQITPRAIVLHWTGGSTVESAWSTFAPTRAASARPDLAAQGEVNVSAHFLVGRDGIIYRLMSETTMARHCIGLNAVAIGVENVGDGAANPLTEAQIEANAALVRDLVGRYPTITHLLGHLEYRAMEGHPYFRERDPGYRTGKADPGAPFMAAVRARVADLGLEGPPPLPRP